MKNAFLFPGQGSQSVGMGKELYDSISEAKRILDMACDILGYDLKTIMFEGPVEKLIDTRYAQPAIYTCSAMYLEKSKQADVEYEYTAGHSLGEYSADYAAGVLEFEDGLLLVNERAKYMSGQNGNGSMLAVMGMPVDELQTIVDKIEGIVIANLNTMMQTVVSGTNEGIYDLQKQLSDNDSVIIKPLQVSAAFHSPLMQDAADKMKPILEKVPLKSSDVHVVPNVTAIPTRKTGLIRECLIRQITGQVHWFESIQAMCDAGVECFYECGNGKVLKRMNKVISPNTRCLSI